MKKKSKPSYKKHLADNVQKMKSCLSNDIIKYRHNLENYLSSIIPEVEKNGINHLPEFQKPFKKRDLGKKPFCAFLFYFSRFRKETELGNFDKISFRMLKQSNYKERNLIFAYFIIIDYNRLKPYIDFYVACYSGIIKDGNDFKREILEIIDTFKNSLPNKIEQNVIATNQNLIQQLDTAKITIPNTASLPNDNSQIISNMTEDPVIIENDEASIDMLHDYFNGHFDDNFNSDNENTNEVYQFNLSSDDCYSNFI